MFLFVLSVLWHNPSQGIPTCNALVGVSVLWHSPNQGIQAFNTPVGDNVLLHSPIQSKPSFFLVLFWWLCFHTAQAEAVQHFMLVLVSVCVVTQPKPKETNSCWCKCVLTLHSSQGIPRFNVLAGVDVLLHSPS